MEIDRRLLLAVALSVIAHILFFLVFLNREEKDSLIESEQAEKGIEVTLTTLPKAKPVAKTPESTPPPVPKPSQPVPKLKPAPRLKPAPKPPREEPTPEFKDDFQQLSNSYTRDAPASTQAESAASNRAKPDTGVHPGAILNINPRIYYPRNAMRQGMQGVVVVLIHISPDGHTDGVDLIQSSGYDELDNQVLGAVQHWRFAPPMRGNTPVEGTYKHTVIFGADQEVVDDFATHWREVKLLPAK